VIGLLRVGKVQEAGAILFENNPLSAITGAVCPNHLFCKGGCVKGVDFGVIEREVSRKYLEAHTPPSSLGHPFTLKGNILIVGSGPAGLSLSYYLAKVGYKVEVWERCEKLGGMLRYGIPDFRLDKGLIDKVFGVIKRYGVVFKTNMQVDLRDLPKGFDMIVLAIGAGVSRRLDVEGGEYVEYALDFLKNSTTPSPTAPPLTFGASLTLSKGNYVVIGAGNVAIDCALTAVELGAKTVNLCYRRDEAAMKAYPEELAHARNKGVVFNYFYVPKKITKEGVLFDRQGEEIFMPADKVVVAIGQGAVCLDESVKIGCTANGLIQVDGFRTNIEGVYALGDAVTGTSTIIQVVAQAKELAKQLS
jgi:glutamate synthase (NADPH/NADH) small chain